jgi:phenylalanyl-tRNA synthetase alpha chain
MELQQEFISKLALAADLASLEELRINFLGKKGLVSSLMQNIATLAIEEKKSFGAEVNQLKNFIERELEAKKNAVRAALTLATIAAESIDITLPPRKYTPGSIHPITQAILDIESIFARMGFIKTEGREIEDDWHNFTALNIPLSHPARQMHDTFYLAASQVGGFSSNEISDDAALLLRTHTSSVQIRHMKDNKPPVRIISIGRVYRADDDATHTPMFHQIEGLCIDKNINMAHLKYTLETFLKLFFQVAEAPIRLRPSFFPFTEPSAEADVRCDRSDKNSIKIGEGQDWLEVLGCGMVHPHVLKNMGVDSEEYQGFAFGIGIERLVMLKYNIPDLRALFAGNIWS